MIRDISYEEYRMLTMQYSHQFFPRILLGMPDISYVAVAVGGIPSVYTFQYHISFTKPIK